MEVFEQAASYDRVGADINLTPNAVRALDGLGVVDALRRPRRGRRTASAACGTPAQETSRLEMADAAEQKYGAPQLTIHRADLLERAARSSCRPRSSCSATASRRSTTPGRSPVVALCRRHERVRWTC